MELAGQPGASAIWKPVGGRGGAGAVAAYTVTAMDAGTRRRVGLPAGFASEPRNTLPRFQQHRRIACHHNLPSHPAPDSEQAGLAAAGHVRRAVAGPGESTAHGRAYRKLGRAAAGRSCVGLSTSQVQKPQCCMCSTQDCLVGRHVTCHVTEPPPRPGAPHLRCSPVPRPGSCNRRTCPAAACPWTRLGRGAGWGRTGTGRGQEQRVKRGQGVQRKRQQKQREQWRERPVSQGRECAWLVVN